MQNFTLPLIIPANTLMNANLTSVAIPVNNTYTCAIQVVFTGTPTGTFSLQASCDQANATVANNPNANFTTSAKAPTHWTTVASSSQAVSAAGDLMWNIQDIGYNWLRLVYTDSSGGTSTAHLTVSTFTSKTMS